MAPTKRKRDSTRNTPSKRHKYVNSSEAEPTNASPTYWEAECILAERVRRGKQQFLIKWQGANPKTGRTWEPTWEPEDNANELLRASWAHKKAQTSASTTAEVAKNTKNKGRMRKQLALQTSRPSRQARMIESSADTSTIQSSPPLLDPSTPARESATPPAVSSTITTPVDVPAVHLGRLSRIPIPPRGSSFDPGDFDRFSQLLQSQPTTEQSCTQETDLDSSDLFATTRLFLSGIVPDSQSSEGEATFVPLTQRTNQSTITNESQEKDIIGDLDLLEVAHEAASRGISPARYIAETLPDTVADSQTQVPEPAQDLVEIPDTLGTIESSQPVRTVTGEDSVPIEQSAALGALEETGTVAGTEDPSESVGSQQFGTYQVQETLVEKSVVEENAQVVFHSQHSLHSAQFSQDNWNGTSEYESSNTGALVRVGVDPGHSIALALHPEEAVVPTHVEHTTIPQSSLETPLQFDQKHPDSPLRSKEQDDYLLNEFLEPEYTRSLTPIVAQTQQFAGGTGHTAAQASHISQDVSDTVLRRDFATLSQVLYPIGQSTYFREQNAQVIALVADLNTQEEISESIRPTIETELCKHRGSSESRHDSSQETPERQLGSGSADKGSSPIRQPPNHSLGTQDAKVPPRPFTPLPTPSLLSMAGHSTGDEMARKLKELQEKAQRENPYTPTRRLGQSTVTPSATAPEASVAASISARRLLRTNASPTVLDGTRSPSSVPDRSPAPQVPTSLRCVASIPINSALRHAETAMIPEVQSGDAAAEATVTAEEPVPPAEIPAAAAHDDEELSDADDEDSVSVLNDDLHLAPEEYIVPLFIEGRQLDMYSGHISHHKELLEELLKDRHGFEPLGKIEGVLTYLQAIETHIDLVYAEADSSSWTNPTSESQAEFEVQFGMENSVKFRFLHTIFHHLRDHRKHIVIVTEHDNDALFHILETFCKAQHINYNLPTKGRQADPSHSEGDLSVSIFSSDASPILRTPDLIICLDGVQDAGLIRQKNWAQSTNDKLVPVLHLVIPHTLGHIERHISPTLDKRDRIHTILASLAQMRGELGKPINEHTPRAPTAAANVVDWLISAEDDPFQWPLPSIGSVMDIIEFQTQLSQAATPPPAPERNKRPLEDDDLDPAKRMRFTPQPQTAPVSSVKEHEVTRISGSMPGTAVEEVSLQKQLVRAEEALRKEHAAREAEQRRFQEHEVMWDKQQTVHEDLTREYRLLLGQHQAVAGKLDAATKDKENSRERLTTRTAELRQISEQLAEQRATHLLSEDAKIVEITRLRTDLANAREERQRALKQAESIEASLEYMKEIRRVAEEAATTSQSTVDELTKSNAKLQRQASGQPAKLKALHLDRYHDALAQQLKIAKNENAILKRTLGHKEEELARAKNGGRMGVGTRGQSVTPQPKIRSRAGSPMGGRVSNLRKE